MRSKGEVACVICPICELTLDRRTNPAVEMLCDRLLACALIRQYVAEYLPALAFEARQLDGLDRVEIRGAGVDLDTRQQHWIFETLQACRLLHDVLAREVVATLLQDLGHGGPGRIAVDMEGAALVA